MKFDVLIVGAGAAGLYAAIAAGRSGASVLLIDKGVVGRGGATTAKPCRQHIKLSGIAAMKATARVECK